MDGWSLRMEAPRCVATLVLLTLTGCTADMLKSAPRPHATDPNAAAPAVAENTEPNEPAPSDPLAAQVDDYIRQVEQARDLAAQRSATALSATPPDARPAADVQPAAATQPILLLAEPAPSPVVAVEPEPEPAPVAPPPLAPPTLLAVDVQPALSGPVPSEPPAEPPAINGAVVARTGPANLRAFLEQAVPAEDASFREQLDARVLWLVAGDTQRAREPLKLVTAEQQELATRFIEALLAIRGAHAGDLSAAATAAAQPLAELQEALGRLTELSIPTVKICGAVRGFGQFDELDPARFVAGGTAEFVLYCEVRDFVSEQRDDGFYHTTFDLTTTILDRAGNAVLELKDPQIVDRCRNRRHDCFIPRLVRLPASLAPGHYVTKVTLVDKLGQKVAENRANFQLIARP